MMGESMRKIRTTLEPGREIEVSEQEYTDLKRQALVHEQPTPASKPTDKNKGN